MEAQWFAISPSTIMSDQPARDPKDRTEFLKLFLEHQDDLRAFIGAVVRNVSLRDDVFQEVAMTLWKSFDKYDPQRPFGAWARGVAKNRVLKYYRSEGKFPMPLAPAAIEATLNAFDAIDSFDRGGAWEDALEACLQQLPSRSRKVLCMRYNKDTDISTMATTLRRTAAAIYQSLSRIRKQLELCVRERLQASS